MPRVVGTEEGRRGEDESSWSRNDVSTCSRVSSKWGEGGRRTGLDNERMRGDRLRARWVEQGGVEALVVDPATPRAGAGAGCCAVAAVVPAVDGVEGARGKKRNQLRISKTRSVH